MTRLWWMNHKRNVFCLSRQRAFLLAFQAKKRAKTGIFGLQCGQPAAAEPDFLLSERENGRKCWYTFCVSLLCKEHQKSTGWKDLNPETREKVYETDNFVTFNT